MSPHSPLLREAPSFELPQKSVILFLLLAYLPIHMCVFFSRLICFRGLQWFYFFITLSPGIRTLQTIALHWCFCKPPRVPFLGSTVQRAPPRDVCYATCTEPPIILSSTSLNKYLWDEWILNQISPELLPNPKIVWLFINGRTGPIWV